MGQTTTAEQTAPITNEASAFSSILDWSTGCPVWQRDALRRLCIQDKLEESDLAELLKICKGTAIGSPLEAIHVRSPAAGNAVVTIGALHSLENVNALAVGERLTFCKAGLTVVYGDNGAGKSGYARILKQLCRARSPKGETILPNIYTENPGMPKASLDYSVGAQKSSVTWTLGTSTDAMLSAISVFDSRTANVHVDNINDLAYTPLPLKILAALAQACQNMKTCLNDEIQALKKQTPEVISIPKCKSETAVGKLMASLSAVTKPIDVENLSSLDSDQDARLELLRTDLSSDPARAARQIQAIKSKFDNATERLLNLTRAISDEEVALLRSSAQAFAAARKAALAASTNLFSSEPLPDIGSDAWKTLWEAARVYSQESAYPEQPFPVIQSGARCVLCQQELDEASANRLQSFESFIKDESKRQEAAARNIYEQKLGSLTATKISIRDMLAFISTVRDDMGNTLLADEMRKEAVKALWRFRFIVRTHRLSSEHALPQPPVIPFSKMALASQELAQRMTVLLAEDGSPVRAALVAEYNELVDRKWLSLIKNDVLAQIQRLKSIASLSRLVKETTTNRITALSTDLADALVTNRLRGRFSIEVNKLGIAGLAIELQQAKTSAGVPYFQVRLINKPSEPVGKILSEGEHRCVALAAFLAELVTVDAQSAIVFDDPVSSLDHLHRDKVAARLAEEGRDRQVIVFTHDIAFLLLLDEACRATKEREAVQVSYRLVSRNTDSAGFCHEDPPTNVMPLDKVIEGMRKHLANVKIHHERGDQAKWQREVTSFQDQLRTTWERSVEEALSPVIKRLSRKVETAGLMKLTIIEPEDCKTMREAFGRCSMLLHSQPGELNPRLPSPATIESEINTLSQWISDIRDRQDKVD
ncbi:MAG: AAA family ATPase [Alphaproteobacteria bacterium]|nr:AAA family ATPase [Alphaproteobacteria bacterium]